MQVYKVLGLPRILYVEVHKVRCPARNLHVGVVSVSVVSVCVCLCVHSLCVCDFYLCSFGVYYLCVWVPESLTEPFLLQFPPRCAWFLY